MIKDAFSAMERWRMEVERGSWMRQRVELDGCGCVGNQQASRQVSDPGVQRKQGLAMGSLQVSLKGYNNVVREEKPQQLSPTCSY